MQKKILENINELFSSYDLFSYSGTIRNREKMKTKMPDITEVEMTELEAYLKSFYKDCIVYGNRLADKYKVPFLPNSDEAKSEIDEYVKLCQLKYPQIDEKHIQEVFSTVCWLANR